MTRHEHLYAICCQPEAAGGVISGRNAYTMKGYGAQNFEVASSCSFRDISKNHFVMAAESDIDDSIRRKRFGVSLKKLDGLLSAFCRRQRCLDLSPKLRTTNVRPVTRSINLEMSMHKILHLRRNGKQGHHQSADQAARRPHIFGTIFRPPTL